MKSHGLPTLSRVTGRQSLSKNHRLCKNLKAAKQKSWKSLALSCIHPQRWRADKGGQLKKAAGSRCWTQACKWLGPSCPRPPVSSLPGAYAAGLGTLRGGEDRGHRDSHQGSCSWWNSGDRLTAPTLEAHEGLRLGASEAGSQRV